MPGRRNEFSVLLPGMPAAICGGGKAQTKQLRLLEIRGLQNLAKLGLGGQLISTLVVLPVIFQSTVPLLLCFLLTALSLLSQAMLSVLCGFLMSPSSLLALNLKSS